MAKIRSLPMNVTRERAVAKFRSPGPTGLLRAWRCGPLRSVADAYVPFLLYRVRIRNASKQEEKLLALDAVRGTLDPYFFPSIPRPEDLIELETRNYIEPALSLAAADRIIFEKARRIVFGAGLFKIRDLSINPELIPISLHIPYWIGFSGRGENANLAVLDAIRGQLEGPKARSLFVEWLSSSEYKIAGEESTAAEPR